ncbi:hypothetical protein HYDPIDRAFT_110282 [Hydnomerulius pinastri MD-312]|nr:hypothetical protein HYDPIDRAFT_110282 [Hydnomerulius pinastri MD-312]
MPVPNFAHLRSWVRFLLEALAGSEGREPSIPTLLRYVDSLSSLFRDRAHICLPSILMSGFTRIAHRHLARKARKPTVAPGAPDSAARQRKPLNLLNLATVPATCTFSMTYGPPMKKWSRKRALADPEVSEGVIANDEDAAGPLFRRRYF